MLRRWDNLINCLKIHEDGELRESVYNPILVKNLHEPTCRFSKANLLLFLFFFHFFFGGWGWGGEVNDRTSN